MIRERYLKWRQMKKSTNVRYQRDMYKAQPKARITIRDDLGYAPQDRKRIAYGDFVTYGKPK